MRGAISPPLTEYHDKVNGTVQTILVVDQSIFGSRSTGGAISPFASYGASRMQDVEVVACCLVYFVERVVPPSVHNPRNVLDCRTSIPRQGTSIRQHLSFLQVMQQSV
ncbi:unnamed protein product, partial [Ectocarpus sp. 12 AP-2014]